MYLKHKIFRVEILNIKYFEDRMDQIYKIPSIDFSNNKVSYVKNIWRIIHFKHTIFEA